MTLPTDVVDKFTGSRGFIDNRAREGHKPLARRERNLREPADRLNVCPERCPVATCPGRCSAATCRCAPCACAACVSRATTAREGRPLALAAIRGRAPRTSDEALPAVEPEPDRYVSSPEAARALGLHPSTLAARRRRGELVPALECGPGQRWYRLSAVRELAEPDVEVPEPTSADLLTKRELDRAKRYRHKWPWMTARSGIDCSHALKGDE